MRYLFLPGLLMLLSQYANSQETDSLFISSALLKLKNAKEYTLKVADLMPSKNYNYRPTEDEMNFGEQLLHIAGNLAWLSTSYLNSGTNANSKIDNKLKDKDSIRKVLVRTYDNAINVLMHFRPENLSDTVNFFAGPMNKMQVINLINDHQTHHRGQLLVYLRLSGITPPKYIGW